MSLNLRIVILICGISFSIAIIRLLINKKFSERITLIWLISAMAVFVISIFPRILDIFASILGVDYPPSILFLLTILILLFICFYHSLQISMLNNQVREITQNMVVKEEVYLEDLDLKFYNIKRFESDLIEEVLKSNESNENNENNENNESNEEDMDLKLYFIKP